MRQFMLGLGAMAVFAAGCAAGVAGIGVERAKAAAGEEQRWAYLCFDAQTTEEVLVKANEAGARGWEMASSVAHPAGGSTWCFRRLR